MRFLAPLKSLAIFVLVAGLTFLAATTAKSVCSALEPQPAAVAPKSQPTAAGEAPAHHKLLYRIARDRAVAQYSRDKGIARAAAKEKADHLDDSTIHAAVHAAGLKVQDLPVGASKLEDFLQWIVDHQDIIVSVVKIILTLLALLG